MKKMVQQMMIYLHLTMHPQKTTPMQRWKKSTESRLIEKETNRFQSDTFDLLRLLLCHLQSYRLF